MKKYSIIIVVVILNVLSLICLFGNYTFSKSLLPSVKIETIKKEESQVKKVELVGSFMTNYRGMPFRLNDKDISLDNEEINPQKNILGQYQKIPVLKRPKIDFVSQTTEIGDWIIFLGNTNDNLKGKLISNLYAYNQKTEQLFETPISDIPIFDGVFVKSNDKLYFVGTTANKEDSSIKILEILLEDTQMIVKTIKENLEGVDYQGFSVFQSDSTFNVVFRNKGKFFVYRALKDELVDLSKEISDDIYVSGDPYTISDISVVADRVYYKTQTELKTFDLNTKEYQTIKKLDTKQILFDDEYMFEEKDLTITITDLKTNHIIYEGKITGDFKGYEVQINHIYLDGKRVPFFSIR
ncbi:hypothetical protein KG091_05780 [Carnobacteriaceae bacterium zg-ZUI78]|nr:hypothetical protein [Carnobacteriaceae bacterium zg-ZUI78]